MNEACSIQVGNDKAHRILVLKTLRKEIARSRCTWKDNIKISFLGFMLKENLYRIQWPHAKKIYKILQVSEYHKESCMLKFGDKFFYSYGNFYFSEQVNIYYHKCSIPLMKIGLFQVALFQLPDVSLMVSVYNKRSMKRKEMIGWFSLGLNSSGEEELAHWNDMRDVRGEQICRWHVLVES
jgi:hypothetical protein